MLFFFSCKEKKEAPRHEYTNALISETSPYLLQHAHNPVNWNSWSEDQLGKAKKENKLIVLSIGYSSCHWCHVMEDETFEDTQVANFMNANFINIKVDREERPDIDQVYQTAIQLIGQNGGWPLNAVVLPNGKPIYLGTYHTKEEWMEVLSNLVLNYSQEPQKMAEYAERLASGIEETNIFEPSKSFDGLTTQNLSLAVDQWEKDWDKQHGGNQGNQKFPMPNALDFLLDYAIVSNDKVARDHVENTLDKMAMGGLYDHLGGGFFRYSTDSLWKIPHFEKMLYDNAQLVSLYSKGYKVFQKPRYKQVVLETLAFLEREMSNASGGYYAALDADSEGEEGKFYVWSKAELIKHLGNDFEYFSTYFNVNQQHVLPSGQFTLYTMVPDSTFAKNNDLKVDELIGKKSNWKKTLLGARAQRIRPAVDDKIITSWNALAINAYLSAYQTFGDNTHLKKSIAIFDFLKQNCYNDGVLVHSFKEGSNRKEGFSEDYAFLGDAALQLYFATMDVKYLEFSDNLMTSVMKRFSDPESGLFKFNESQALFANPIKTNDGEIPSPNSVLANNFFKLGHINYNSDHILRSKTMLTTLLGQIIEYPDAYANWARLLMNTVHPYYEIAVIGKDADKILHELQLRSLPNTLIIGSRQESDIALFEERYVAGKTFIYVCQDKVCKLPVESVGAALDQLENF